jgi:hypothetical protein
MAIHRYFLSITPVENCGLFLPRHGRPSSAVADFLPQDERSIAGDVLRCDRGSLKDRAAPSRIPQVGKPKALAHFDWFPQHDTTIVVAIRGRVTHLDREATVTGAYADL